MTHILLPGRAKQLGSMLMYIASPNRGPKRLRAVTAFALPDPCFSTDRLAGNIDDEAQSFMIDMLVAKINTAFNRLSSYKPVKGDCNIIQRFDACARNWHGLNKRIGRKPVQQCQFQALTNAYKTFG